MAPRGCPRPAAAGRISTAEVAPAGHITAIRIGILLYYLTITDTAGRIGREIATVIGSRVLADKTETGEGDKRYFYVHCHLPRNTGCLIPVAKALSIQVIAHRRFPLNTQQGEGSFTRTDNVVNLCQGAQFAFFG